MKKNRTLKITAITIFLILLLVGFLYFALKQVNNFFNSYSIAFNQIVKVQFKEPMTFNKRAILKPVTIIKVLNYPDEIDSPIEKYICDKFGAYDCKVALAIVKVESGFNDQAFNANTNDSVDLGCWQINFPTHLKTISPKDALDCYKATDWAFEKYKRDGSFQAWVGFTNGNFKNHLEE